MKNWKFQIILLTTITGFQLSANTGVETFLSCLASNESSLIGQENSAAELELASAKSSRLPEIEAGLTQNQDILNKNTNESYSALTLDVTQSIYSRSKSLLIEEKQLNLQLHRLNYALKLNDLVVRKIANVFSYLALKDAFSLLQLKSDRQKSLIELLKSLVDSKSSDASSLLLAEADLTLLNLRKNDLQLAILRAENDLILPENLLKLIVGTNFSKYLNLSDYRRSDPTEKLAVLQNLKEISLWEAKSVKLDSSWTPKLDFSGQYVSFLTNSNLASPKNTFNVGLVLTLPLSEYYLTQSEVAYTKRELNRTLAARERNTRLEQIRQEHNQSRVKLISDSIDHLTKLEISIQLAKKIILKKVIVNKASYSDYINVDDKMDEIAKSISLLKFEKSKIILSAEAEHYFANQDPQTVFSCDLQNE